MAGVSTAVRKEKEFLGLRNSIAVPTGSESKGASAVGHGAQLRSVKSSQVAAVMGEDPGQPSASWSLLTLIFHWEGGFACGSLQMAHVGPGQRHGICQAVPAQRSAEQVRVWAGVVVLPAVLCPCRQQSKVIPLAHSPPAPPPPALMGTRRPPDDAHLFSLSTSQLW